MRDPKFTHVPREAEARRKSFFAGRRGSAGADNPYVIAKREPGSGSTRRVPMDGRAKRMRLQCTAEMPQAEHSHTHLRICWRGREVLETWGGRCRWCILHQQLDLIGGLMFTRNSSVEPKMLEQRTTRSSGGNGAELSITGPSSGEKSVIGNDLKIIGQGLKIISRGMQLRRNRSTLRWRR